MGSPTLGISQTLNLNPEPGFGLEGFGFALSSEPNFPTTNIYKAFELANSHWPHLDITGIRIACARPYLVIWKIFLSLWSWWHYVPIWHASWAAGGRQLLWNSALALVSFISMDTKICADPLFPKPSQASGWRSQGVLEYLRHVITCSKVSWQ